MRKIIDRNDPKYFEKLIERSQRDFKILHLLADNNLKHSVENEEFLRECEDLEFGIHVLKSIQDQHD
jgi:hypothetical protein